MTFDRRWLSPLAVAMSNEDYKTSPFHYVTGGPLSFVHPDDIMGYVYITEDNKAVYWDGASEDKAAASAHYLQKAATEILGREVRGFLLHREIGQLAGEISPEHRRQLLFDYYGEQKGLTMLKNSLG